MSTTEDDLIKEIGKLIAKRTATSHNTVSALLRRAKVDDAIACIYIAACDNMRPLDALDALRESRRTGVGRLSYNTRKATT